MITKKIGFGGGCHWCTEAVFQAIEGVVKVEQGWITSEPPYHYPSEAVIVYYNSKLISLNQLIEIHLLTHSCNTAHQFREKYRSAIYTYEKSKLKLVSKLLADFQIQYEEQLITKALFLASFKLNKEQYLNYYKNNPEKPFCQRYIIPKFQVLKTRNYSLNLEV